MTARRKTLPLEDVRKTVNRTIANAATALERDTASHVWQALTLHYENTYKGFMYVDEMGDAVSHVIIGSGTGYDPTRRFYF